MAYNEIPRYATRDQNLYKKLKDSCHPAKWYKVLLHRKMLKNIRFFVEYNSK